MLTIWGRATSSNVQKVMWVVGELALDHQRIDVGGPFGGLDTPEFRAINPTGLIPAMQMAEGPTMFESNAIMRFLAHHDDARRLWPKSLEGEADMWAEWAHNTVARPVIALFWAAVRTKPDAQNPATIAAHLAAAETAMALAEDALGRQPYLAGDTLTIADIVFGHVLFRYFTMAVERAPLPNVSAYYQGLTERPAYAAHVMVDYTSLYGTA